MAGAPPLPMLYCLEDRWVLRQGALEAQLVLLGPPFARLSLHPGEVPFGAGQGSLGQPCPWLKRMQESAAWPTHRDQNLLVLEAPPYDLLALQASAELLFHLETTCLVWVALPRVRA